MTPRSPPPAFLGRSVEVATLVSAIADAQTGLPSVLLVSGDAGMGKSTLVAEGARRAEAGMQHFVIGLLPDDVETAELVAEKVMPAFA